ncbi:C5a anaphylatoxin chemotactic receptor 1 [Bagarius yarrelli]|uniref:C5a anaphylatoxin chemotactic receptor 1 n=1 Tax=Bagarius yarrelli TaxID=175774 RepID=A0A556TQJ9_BAGYA|nr:C5a anaphylatoxin chemotactic receptor 1 [Bagarius yarrelli]
MQKNNDGGYPLKTDELHLFIIFPDPLDVELHPEGTLGCVPQGKERLPSIVVEPTDINEVESGELRWPPEQEDSEDEDLFLEQCIPPANIVDWGEEEDEDESISSSSGNQPSRSLLAKMEDYDDYGTFDFNSTANPCEGVKNCSLFVNTSESVIGWRHWIVLICYIIVFLLGVPGNGLVVWVTAFRMPRSVNAMWFLNLALTDLLCCLSLPLLMVPLTQDLHWPFGPVACKLVNGLLYMLMYCSVVILTIISLDRWLLVTRPAWCQNWRQPHLARWVCVGAWVLALIGTIPQFFHMSEEEFGKKIRCRGHYLSLAHGWAMVVMRFLLAFLIPFAIICFSHWTVYQRARRKQNDKSSRTLRVILAVVITFFLCWIPLHVIDTVMLMWQNPVDTARANLHLVHLLAVCLAYFNSCLNPLLYVCLGRGFRESLTKTLKSVLNFASEEPTRGHSVTMNTKSTTDTKY